MRTCVSPIIESADIAAAAAGIIDSEALIVVDLTIVSADGPSSQGEELRIANILFNNLDIIGEYCSFLRIRLFEYFIILFIFS